MAEEAKEAAAEAPKKPIEDDGDKESAAKKAKTAAAEDPEEVVYVHADGMMHPTTPPSAWQYPKPVNEADKGTESIAKERDPEEDFHTA